MREKENESQQMVAAILNMNSVGDMIISSLIIIGLLNRLVPKSFYSAGCLQTIF
jgi:hypothetical protein